MGLAPALRDRIDALAGGFRPAARGDPGESQRVPDSSGLIVEPHQRPAISTEPGDRLIGLPAIQAVAQWSLAALSRGRVRLDGSQDVADGHLVHPFHAVIGDFQGVIGDSV